DALQIVQDHIAADILIMPVPACVAGQRLCGRRRPHAERCKIAVKHGILKNLEGGTVTIRTYENRDAFIIEVIDDGVGFDVSKYTSGGSKHIGLQNVKSRIVSMVRGDMEVESEIGKGTKITVAIYK
ncbi:MAG: hypothetical protein II619_02445, partial [Bacilli bacterium]|nr:hypothetical protein [Bacilli bacterium]